jgi:propanol-preferring alcohol dehydrogenase
VALQYAKAMGTHVAAVDVSDDKLALAHSLGAELTINAAHDDPAIVIQRSIGGAHGVLITAVSSPAFSQGIGMLRPHGTCVLVGLPPGAFPTPIFDVVLKRLTIRGSIVGTRKDLQEALQFAAEGKVKTAIEVEPLEAINSVFDRLLHGQVQGRVVLQLG